MLTLNHPLEFSPRGTLVVVYMIIDSNFVLHSSAHAHLLLTKSTTRLSIDMTKKKTLPLASLEAWWTAEQAL